MRPRLRLFTEPEAGSSVLEPQVSVRLGDITEALADAVTTNRAWLSDFEDDEIRITSDLYEVLSAYRHLRPSA